MCKVERKDNEIDLDENEEENLLNMPSESHLLESVNWN